MAVYSEASNRLQTIEAQANEDQLGLVDDVRGDYSRYQDVLMATAAAAEIIARRHPEWFSRKATLTTPYGQVKLADNPPKLESENEELSVVMIETHAEKDPEFKPELYLRTVKSLNLDALKTLDDGLLKKFRIKRTQSDTFSIKPTKLDLGKAVEKAAETK